MKKLLLLILIFSISFTITSCATRVLPDLGDVPRFMFTEHNGGVFGVQHLRGKISVVDFIFTNCPGICPTMTANMKELYEAYADSIHLQFVSISVDPDRDSLFVLQKYALAQRVYDDRWKFLRAPIEEVVKLSEDGFKLAADDLPGGHSNKFALVDEDGQIRAYHDGTSNDLKPIRADIDMLLREAY
ncbi:SCO family protein [Calditrichota bacterium]